MSVQVERLDNNMARLTIEIPAEEFSKAVNDVYMRSRGKISIPGFRKGKVPRKLIEKYYGTGVFYEDAANDVINNTYTRESEESGLEIMSRPEIDVVQVNEGEPFIYTATVALRPEVKLGNYKGIEVTKRTIEVTDEEIEAELRNEQEKNSRLIDVDDRPAQMGDTVTIDYMGTVGGVAFDGGTSSDYPLVLGSNTFIPGFEEQLVGVSAGEDKDVFVTFPKEYHSADLAGKEALFECKVKKIQMKELPELDDDFAQDVSEFDTLEEYKKEIRAGIYERKEKQAQTEKENEAVGKLIETSEMEIPDAMIDTQAAQMFQEFAQSIQSQGIPWDMYMKYQNQTPQQMMEEMKPQAERRIRTRLVLEEVVKDAGIVIDDARVDEELGKMAAAYQIEKEKLAENMTDAEKEQMKKDLAVQEALTLLAAGAKEV